MWITVEYVTIVQYSLAVFAAQNVLSERDENAWERVMHITYKKLWKLLIDREMNKQDLKRECNISSASVAKLGKCENITTDVLVRICEGLHCRLEDIMELEEDAPARQ